MSCGIVLQIAIHSDDVFAARVIETSGEPGSLAEIAAKFHHGDTAVYGSNLAQHREGVIAGAIIHQHNFERFTSGLHDRFQAVVEVGDVLLLVMQRDDDGVFRHSLFIIA